MSSHTAPGALAVPPMGRQAPRRIVHQRVPAHRPLDGAGGGERVAGERLGRTHRHLRAEQLRHGQAFHRIVVRCRRVVQVHVVDGGGLQLRALQRLLHGGEGAAAGRLRHHREQRLAERAHPWLFVGTRAPRDAAVGLAGDDPVGREHQARRERLQRAPQHAALPHDDELAARHQRIAEPLHRLALLERSAHDGFVHRRWRTSRSRLGGAAAKATGATAPVRNRRRPITA